MGTRRIQHEEVKAELLSDPGVRAAYEELEPAYQVARLRIMRGLTQQQLAERLGTQQSSIARLESGKQKPNLEFLRKVAVALGCQLEVKLVPCEDLAANRGR